MEDNLEKKQKQFNDAMYLYENKPIYQIFGKVISIINIGLQGFLLYLITPINIGIWWQIFSFVIAFLLADFINGLVHMYMDNNDNYDSLAGPLIASFHMHHRTPPYKKNPVIIVYFNESGSKVWLAVFLIVITFVIVIWNINSVLLYIILYFCLLSSIAEVSHYFCHSSNSKFVEYIRKTGFFLKGRHHINHHITDNVSYAFLNGISDPLINIIAKRFYKGYKNSTDLHYKNYTGKNTKNRV